jgi:hypothetical protein
MSQDPKVFWRRNEIPIADYLMSHQDALRDDFMRGFDTLEAATMAQSFPTMDRRQYGVSIEETEKYITTDNKPNIQAWRDKIFRYELHTDTINASYTAPDRFRERYPTAFKLISEYGADCPIANYSCLAPNSVIQRHTGIENRTGEFIRVHIPLIIPEGDVFFEAIGEEIDWSDLWAFHNQFAHSAHNYSNEWRLCFLIDFRRTAIGLEPGQPYDPSYSEMNVPPFVRKKKQLNNLPG